MNVFFDHQIFSMQAFGGISRYNAELVHGINQSKINQAYLSLLFSNNTHLKELGLYYKPFFPDENFFKKSQILYRFNQAYTILQLRRRSFDIFHPTYYDSYFISNLKGCPFVITIYDMIHEKLASQFPKLANDSQSFRQKHVLANLASKIIAISESTKRDIIDILKVEPSKVQVIYLGNSIASKPENKFAQSVKEPYLLFVGRRERYKNFQGLLSAIHPLLKKYKIKLVCAGGESFTASEHQFINALGAEAWVEQHPINDQRLQSIYRQAIAFIFPSLYEGFGIPILEAFACDCPCIVSNISSLPEVAGDAALYFDPTSSESIAYSVEKLIHDSSLRQSLIMRGREQIKRFSWERTVSETLELYSSLT